MREKILFFDFDGTITTKDTLLEFILYSCGKVKFLLGFLLYSPLLILMKFGLYPNWKAKQHVFSYFFRGMKIDDFDSVCRRFAVDCRYLLRPEAVKDIETAMTEGIKVYVVSASIDNWVQPFFEFAKVLGTQIEVINGILTGRFMTPNCYGPEKVRRIKEVLTEPRSHYYIIAYGDSRGDKEMLDYADEEYFRPFRH
ncbi:MAG: haloacid dehalogenase-like hydrolase [Prevotella sp.]|jgi:HAD superfamily hydrolase (TIGR01490 family)|nr:HAD family hydrolase [Prevotella sp.]MBP6527121.1 haloacid dehalogenase-like hydrolase [Prevotella sp.]MBP7097182.1 haloacid dehalogenase-like hydrolase [Prevotella sp.]MBP8686038.1 haloacid dehalogenase-like hydrolase [Prevotella sp.]